MANKQRFEIGNKVAEIAEGGLSGVVTGVQKAPNPKFDWVSVKVEGKILDRMYQDSDLKLIEEHVHNWLSK